MESSMGYVRCLFRWLTFSAAFLFSIAEPAEAALYTLTVQTNGLAAVTRNPVFSGYPQGSVVTLTALPETGWYFSGWTGDESGNANPLNVTMTSNKLVVANFLPLPKYSLTLFTNGMGSVSLTPPGDSFFSNSVVSLSASPATGWVFAKWLGDESSTANPITLTMDSSKSVTAVFAQLPAIPVPPQSVFVQAGTNVNLSVQAVGTEPLFYEWWFAGAKLADSTNATLVLRDLQPSAQGVYLCVVSNAYGMASNSVTLAVTNSSENVVSIANETVLRNAIALGGLVRLAFDGTVILTSTLEITNDVAIDARNHTVTLSGNNAVRLFYINSGKTFCATNVVLANGRNIGFAGGTGQPGSPGEGAAILSEGGRVVLNACTFVSNSVTGGKGGAGIYPGPGGEGRGGAILARGGSLLLESVVFSNNAATNGAGWSDLGTQSPSGDSAGGAIYITNASAILNNCLLTNNAAVTSTPGNAGAARGGAAFLASGHLSLSNSCLSGNLASGGPAGMSSPPGTAYGGAIAVLDGTVTVVRCQFNTNTVRGDRPGAGQAPEKPRAALFFPRRPLWFWTPAFSKTAPGRGRARASMPRDGVALCVIWAQPPLAGVRSSPTSRWAAAEDRLGEALTPEQPASAAGFAIYPSWS